MFYRVLFDSLHSLAIWKLFYKFDTKNISVKLMVNNGKLMNRFYLSFPRPQRWAQTKMQFFGNLNVMSVAKLLNSNTIWKNTLGSTAVRNPSLVKTVVRGFLIPAPTRLTWPARSASLSTSRLVSVFYLFSFVFIIMHKGTLSEVWKIE